MTYPQGLQGHETPASVVDIVSYGYKSAVKTFIPLTKLMAPVLLCAAYMGFYQAYIAGMDKKDPAQLGIIAVLGLLSVVSSIVLSYAHYVVARYANDTYADQLKPDSLFSYWLPKKSLKHVIVLMIVFFLVAIPIFIVGLIGLALLAVPGIIWFSLIFTSYSMIYAMLIQTPDNGVVETIKECYSLQKGNFLRTSLLGFLTGLIYAIISSPLYLFKGILGAMGKWSPAFVHSLPYFGVSVTVYSVLIWFGLCFGSVGVLLVNYRYVSDLRARKKATDSGLFSALGS